MSASRIMTDAQVEHKTRNTAKKLDIHKRRIEEFIGSNIKDTKKDNAAKKEKRKVTGRALIVSKGDDRLNPSNTNSTLSMRDLNPFMSSGFKLQTQ
ncbi:hypothetical protein HK096_003166 [Nowakowskiella sp. JEL0078]|nr:hypothetical protein HK096_003166 [Nowakowskiella sp. JEL0078]